MRPQPTLDLNRPDGVWSPPSSQGCFPTSCGRKANHSLPTSCGFQRADAAAVFSWKSTPSMMHAVPSADLRKDSMVSDFTVFALRTVHNDSPSIRDSEHRGSTIATSRAGPDSPCGFRRASRAVHFPATANQSLWLALHSHTVVTFTKAPFHVPSVGNMLWIRE